MDNDIWIKEVEIINFKTHKHTKLEFVKGTNAIVGSSNNGKTNILRAIKWCLINEPSGTKFIRKGETEAAVIVSLSNGKRIERRRNLTNINLYRLYEAENIIGEYSGFGSSVPQEITEAHGIVPIADGTYFQFANQLESAFMISLRPSQRADIIGNLEELSRIDAALTDLNSDIRTKTKLKNQVLKTERDKTAELESMRQKAAASRVRISTLKSLKEGIEKKIEMQRFLVKQLERLNEILIQVSDLEKEVSKSAILVNSWPDDMNEKKEKARKLIQATNRLKEIEEELNSIEFMKEDRLKELDILKDEIDSKISKLQVAKYSVDSLKENKIKSEEVAKSFSPVIADMDMAKLDLNVNRYKSLYNQLERLRSIDQTMNETNSAIESSKVKIEDLLNQFIEALQESKLCPTCGQDTHTVCNQNIEKIL